jgi:hypothetical protein
MSQRKCRGLVAFLLAVSLAPVVARGADERRPFAVPKTRAAWEARRAEVRAAVQEALNDVPTRPALPKLELTTPPEPRDGVLVSSFLVDDGTSPPPCGVLALPIRPATEGRAPAVIFLTDGDPMAPGPEGIPVPVALARSGFVVLCRDTHFTEARKSLGTGQGQNRATGAEPSGPGSWPMILRDDLVCLDALLADPQIDPKRVAVGGFGLGGTRAWWLLALDDRLKCASVAGGLTRLASMPPGPWVDRFPRQFDTEAVIALCAPRSLEIMTGTNDPGSALPGALIFRDTVRRVYRLYRPEGHDMETIFAGLGHEFTLLEWDMMLEHFDKELKPQGPTPLGHAPEPEPVVDDRFIDPAANGLAGWVAEMSQRPGTWQWRNGTIVCAPGPNEYGWLRAPIELDDFILSVEWKVPRNGNTGIFLRAKPVEWFVSPSEEGKWKVATRGPEWPSRTGLELQATDDAGKASKYSSSSLYRHAAPAENLVKPAGEWNHYIVRARGPRVEVWCNGRQVLDAAIDHCPTLRQVPLRGYFGLQNHGVGAEFRNVRYLRLTPDSLAATSR